MEGKGQKGHIQSRRGYENPDILACVCFHQSKHGRETGGKMGGTDGGLNDAPALLREGGRQVLGARGIDLAAMEPDRVHHARFALDAPLDQLLEVSRREWLEPSLVTLVTWCGGRCLPRCGQPPAQKHAY